MIEPEKLAKRATHECVARSDLTGPRVETADHIISIGSQPEFTSSLDDARQLATSGMVNRLVKDYGVEPWASHLLIGYQGN